jgi:hypothetical protein
MCLHLTNISGLTLKLNLFWFVNSYLYFVVFLGGVWEEGIGWYLLPSSQVIPLKPSMSGSLGAGLETVFKRGDLCFKIFTNNFKELQ